jgi:hypothetical protein
MPSISFSWLSCNGVSLQVTDDFNILPDFVFSWESWIAVSYNVACQGVLPLKLTSLQHYSNNIVAAVLSHSKYTVIVDVKWHPVSKEFETI